MARIQIFSTTFSKVFRENSRSPKSNLNMRWPLVVASSGRLGCNAHPFTALKCACHRCTLWNKNHSLIHSLTHSFTHSFTHHHALTINVLKCRQLGSRHARWMNECLFSWKNHVNCRLWHVNENITQRTFGYIRMSNQSKSRWDRSRRWCHVNHHHHYCNVARYTSI